MSFSYRCFVPHCNAKSSNGKIPFFSVPKDKILRREWVKAIGVKPAYVVAHGKICGSHFSEDDFVMSSNQVQLVPGIVPHLNLNLRPPEAVKRKLSNCEQEAAVPLDSAMDEDSFGIPAEEIIIKDEPVESFADEVMIKQEEPDYESENASSGIINNVASSHGEKSAKNTVGIVKICLPNNTKIVDGKITSNSPATTELSIEKHIVRTFPLEHSAGYDKRFPSRGPFTLSKPYDSSATEKKLVTDYGLEDMNDPFHAARFYTLIMSKNMQLSNENKTLRAENRSLKDEVARLTTYKTDSEDPLATDPFPLLRNVLESAKCKTESEAEPSTSDAAAEPRKTQETPPVVEAKQQPRKRSRLYTDPFRIVEVSYFINSIFAVQHDHALACPKGKMTILRENLYGMTGHWTFECSVCGHKATIPTRSPLNNDGGETKWLKWLVSLPERSLAVTREVFILLRIPFHYEFVESTTAPREVKCKQSWLRFK